MKITSDWLHPRLNSVEKYIARGGKTETLEGDWSPARLVILQFDSLEQAKSWLNSTEYSAARSLRHKTAISSMVAIEGV